MMPALMRTLLLDQISVAMVVVVVGIDPMLDYGFKD
jgi:hypothetical protein